MSGNPQIKHVLDYREFLGGSELHLSGSRIAFRPQSGASIGECFAECCRVAQRFQGLTTRLCYELRGQESYELQSKAIEGGVVIPSHLEVDSHV